MFCISIAFKDRLEAEMTIAEFAWTDVGPLIRLALSSSPFSSPLLSLSSSKLRDTTPLTPKEHLLSTERLCTVPAFHTQEQLNASINGQLMPPRRKQSFTEHRQAKTTQCSICVM